MAASASELPLDLIGEILLRLPAKSIGRFRCVSNPWRSILTSPKFVKSHRDFHINGDPTGIIIPVSDNVFDEDDVPPHLLISNFDGSSRKVTSPFFIGQSIVLHAVCHGFVLVELDHAILVFNPLTLEAMEVLDDISYHEESVDYIRISRYGLGYDSSSDDYKIVRLLNYNRDSPRREFDGKYVEVYSLKKKSWSRITSIPYKHHDIYHNHVWFVNGRLHWLAWGNKGGFLIAAFNLANEEFEEISPPTKAFPLDGSLLTVFGGCLAVVIISFPYCDVNNINIWVMKEYGVQESWTKIVIDTKGEEDKGEFVCLSGEDELVFTPYANGNPEKFSLSTGVWRKWDLGFDGVRLSFEDARVLPFTEFLLSPEQISTEELED